MIVSIDTERVDDLRLQARSSAFAGFLLLHLGGRSWRSQDIDSCQFRDLIDVVE
jgi:hypothetical protein